MSALTPDTCPLTPKNINLDNNTYIKGLQQKDTKVLQAIYKNFAPRIEQHIKGKGGSSDDAKDVFQDALMVIYNKVKAGDFELTSQFYTYLFGVCHFVWDRKRKKKANITVTIPDDDRLINLDDIEQDIIQRERHTVFRQNFLKLESFCKQLLQYFYDRKNMEEIAQSMGLKNEHTARNRKYRCQKKLEELVKADVRYPELKTLNKK